MTKAGPGGAVRSVLAAVASLLLDSVIASPAAAATPPDRATLARMDGVIRKGMERSGMPGFAVAQEGPVSGTVPPETAPTPALVA